MRKGSLHDAQPERMGVRNQPSRRDLGHFLYLIPALRRWALLAFSSGAGFSGIFASCLGAELTPVSAPWSPYYPSARLLESGKCASLSSF
jgi:hypothetical protein